MPKDDSFPHRKLTATFSSTRCGYWHHATFLFSRYAPTRGASTKPRARVNRQLSPWRIRYSQRTNDEGELRAGGPDFERQWLLHRSGGPAPGFADRRERVAM